MKTTIEAVQTAIEITGSKAALARAVGVTHPAVVRWVKGLSRPSPIQTCERIEKATGGAVTRHELRPDVFGPAPEQQAGP